MQISRMPGSVLHSVLGCLLVYCWAALGCSFLWVLLASLALAAVEQRRQRRREEREAARRLLGAGEEAWLGAGTRLPAWATFPDIESVSWLNTLAAEVSSEATVSIYTVSTQYLHSIYTIYTVSTAGVAAPGRPCHQLGPGAGAWPRQHAGGLSPLRLQVASLRTYSLSDNSWNYVLDLTE